MSKNFELSEHDIQSAIIDYLRRVELGRRIVRLERRNSGVLRHADGRWGAPAYRLYLPGKLAMTKGVPDIEGVLRDGRHFAIECKSKNGELTSEQQIIADYSKKEGLLYLVARSLDDVISWFSVIGKDESMRD